MDEPLRQFDVGAEWDVNKVSVSIMHDGTTCPLVWFKASEGLGKEVDFLLPLTLLPAMATGSHLRLSGLVSPQLFSSMTKVQDVVHVWGVEHWSNTFRRLQRVPVNAEVHNGPVNYPSEVACFFSGGIDSFYSVLKHREEITHLIFVHGFDIRLKDQELRERASRMAHEVARELGKTLIEVETNIRSFSDERIGWAGYHGSALASVALLFQHRFSKVLIPSTHSYAGIIPWGSHPLLDPLWGTERTSIEHDGCEATRPEKVAYVSEHKLAMKWLRVCFFPDGTYNCGHCMKCMTTMLSLRAAGALESCKTLPNDLDLRAVADMDLSGDTLRPLAQQILRALERLGTEPELVEALAEAIDRCPETSEVRDERAERNELEAEVGHLRAKLRRKSAELEKKRNELKAEIGHLRGELQRKRVKLEVHRSAARRLRAENKRFALHNLRQPARCFGRGYRLVGALVERALRTPEAGKVARQEHRGRQAENTDDPPSSLQVMRSSK